MGLTLGKAKPYLVNLINLLHSFSLLCTDVKIVQDRHQCIFTGDLKESVMVIVGCQYVCM